MREYRVFADPKSVDRAASALVDAKLGTVTYWYTDGFDFLLKDNNLLTRKRFETILKQRNASCQIH